MVFKELLHLIIRRTVLEVGLVLFFHAFIKLELKVSRISRVSTVSALDAHIFCNGLIFDRLRAKKASRFDIYRSMGAITSKWGYLTVCKAYLRHFKSIRNAL